MKKIFLVIFLVIVTFTFSLAQENINKTNSTNSETIDIFNLELFKLPRFDSRRITGLVYSSIVPGSGQIYLGNTTKGAAFAVSYFAGLVGTIVSHNNFIGNRERIQSLQFEYLNADRFTLADYYWKQMVSVHNEQKTHEKARNIFIAITAVVWSLNMVDYIFLTEDKGPIEFSLNDKFPNNSFNIFTISIPIK